jgi:hypothetical protein
MRQRVPIDGVVAFFQQELSSAPELWVQKGYLCRVVGKGEQGLVDEGLQPLAYFLDSRDGDAAAASVEVDERGAIIPTVYVRRGGDVIEHLLAPHPLHDYGGEAYATELERLLRPLGG